MSKGLLIAIVGASGSGKSSLAQKLERKFGLTSVRSYTTRSVRPNDLADAFTHTFISPDRVDEYKGDIVCDTMFNHHYYFCTSEQLDANDTYVVDKNGLIQLFANYHNKDIIAIYLDVPAEIAAKRMESRGDNDLIIMSRLQHDAEAFKGAKSLCDFVCPNETQAQQNDICDFINMLFQYRKGIDDD